MEILKDGIDIYDKVNHCSTCGCFFKTTREDALVMHENDVNKFYVECPSCYSFIQIGCSKMYSEEKER